MMKIGVALGEDEVRRILIWKYFEDLHNMDTQEEIAVHICGFDDVQRRDYIEGEPSRKAEVEAIIKKLLKNGKSEDKYEVTRKMIKSGGDIVMN